MNREVEEIKTKFGVWEKHAQTIMLMVVTATIAFTGKFMWNVNSQLAEIVVENRNLSAQVSELKGQIAGMQANYVTRHEFNAYAERLRSIEQKR